MCVCVCVCVCVCIGNYITNYITKREPTPLPNTFAKLQSCSLQNSWWLFNISPWVWLCPKITHGWMLFTSETDGPRCLTFPPVDWWGIMVRESQNLLEAEITDLPSGKTLHQSNSSRKSDKKCQVMMKHIEAWKQRWAFLSFFFLLHFNI